MTVAVLLLVGFLALVVGCLVIAARRGLWLKVEIDEPRAPDPRVVVHRHLHRHVHHHEVAHHHDVEVAHRHEVACHHYLHPGSALPRSVRPTRVGLLARAVLPCAPVRPAVPASVHPPVDRRLIQHVYDPKETE